MKIRKDEHADLRADLEQLEVAIGVNHKDLSLSWALEMMAALSEKLAVVARQALNDK